MQVGRDGRVRGNVGLSCIVFPDELERLDQRNRRKMMANRPMTGASDSSRVSSASVVEEGSDEEDADTWNPSSSRDQGPILCGVKVSTIHSNTSAAPSEFESAAGFRTRKRFLPRLRLGHFQAPRETDVLAMMEEEEYGQKKGAASARSASKKTTRKARVTLRATPNIAANDYGMADIRRFLQSAVNERHTALQSGRFLYTVGWFEQNVPFFSRFSRETVKTLLHRAKLRTIERGHPVYSKGEAADSLYVVLHGRCVLLLNRQVHGMEFVKGHAFGDSAIAEMASTTDKSSAAFLSADDDMNSALAARLDQLQSNSHDGPRRANSVVTLEDTELCEISLELFQKVVWDPNGGLMLQRTQILQKCPVFHDCLLETVTAVANACKEITMEEGEMIISQGDPCNGKIYWIMEGKCRVVQWQMVRLRNRLGILNPQESPALVELGSLDAGSYFGEGAVLASTDRQASVFSASKVKLLILDQSDARSLFPQRCIERLMLHMKRSYVSRKTCTLSVQRQQNWEIFKAKLVKNVITSSRSENPNKLFLNFRANTVKDEDGGDALSYRAQHLSADRYAFADDLKRLEQEREKRMREHRNTHRLVPPLARLRSKRDEVADEVQARRGIHPRTWR